MNPMENILNNLRKQNYRITKPRLAILEVLAEKAMTLKEVHEAVKLRGHHNLATVYNTLDFLEETSLVYVHIVSGEKTYSFVAQHDVKAHVEMHCHDRAHSFDVVRHELIDEIRHHPLFKGFDIDEMEIKVKGHCGQEQKDTCAETGVCMIDKVSLKIS